MKVRINFGFRYDAWAVLEVDQKDLEALKQRLPNMDVMLKEMLDDEIYSGEEGESTITDFAATIEMEGDND